MAYRKFYRKGEYPQYGKKTKSGDEKERPRPSEEIIKGEWITPFRKKGRGQKGPYLLVKTKRYTYFVPEEDVETMEAMKAPAGKLFKAVEGRLSLLKEEEKKREEPPKAIPLPAVLKEEIPRTARLTKEDLSELKEKILNTKVSLDTLLDLIIFLMEEREKEKEEKK